MYNYIKPIANSDVVEGEKINSKYGMGCNNMIDNETLSTFRNSDNDNDEKDIEEPTTSMNFLDQTKSTLNGQKPCCEDEEQKIWDSNNENDSENELPEIIEIDDLPYSDLPAEVRHYIEVEHSNCSICKNMPNSDIPTDVPFEREKPSTNLKKIIVKSENYIGFCRLYKLSSGRQTKLEKELSSKDELVSTCDLKKGMFEPQIMCAFYKDQKNGKLIRVPIWKHKYGKSNIELDAMSSIKEESIKYFKRKRRIQFCSIFNRRMANSLLINKNREKLSSKFKKKKFHDCNCVFCEKKFTINEQFQIHKSPLNIPYPTNQPISSSTNSCSFEEFSNFYTRAMEMERDRIMCLNYYTQDNGTQMCEPIAQLNFEIPHSIISQMRSENNSSLLDIVISKWMNWSSDTNPQKINYDSEATNNIQKYLESLPIWKYTVEDNFRRNTQQKQNNSLQYSELLGDINDFVEKSKRNFDLDLNLHLLDSSYNDEQYLDEHAQTLNTNYGPRVSPYSEDFENPSTSQEIKITDRPRLWNDNESFEKLYSEVNGFDLRLGFNQFNTDSSNINNFVEKCKRNFDLDANQHLLDSSYYGEQCPNEHAQTLNTNYEPRVSPYSEDFENPSTSQEIKITDQPKLWNNNESYEK